MAYSVFHYVNITEKIAIWGWQTPQLPRPEKAPQIPGKKMAKKDSVIMIKPGTYVKYYDKT